MSSQVPGPRASDRPGPTPSGDDVEFPLQPHRRPVRLLEGVGMGVAAIALFCWMGGALVIWAHAPRAAAIPIATLSVVALLGLWWRADHRRYPAGRLRADGEGLHLQDGLGERALRWDELRFLVGTGLGLVLKGRGGRVIVDWPRFQPRAPREVVEALVARVAAAPGGDQVLRRTAQQTQRSAALGRILFWVCLVNGVLIALRMLFERIGAR